MSAPSSGSSVNKAVRPPCTRVAIPGDNGEYRILDLAAEDFNEHSSSLVGMVSTALQENNVDVPVVALREVSDNLIHAVPCSASVVVSPDMTGVSFSDTGPGIPRVDLAFELGYSTASELLRSYIRGVGIGLYLARSDLRSRGGDLFIESDAGGGTYVRLSFGPSSAISGWGGGEPGLSLTQRQNNILFLLSEGESLGPSRVSSELNVGVSTAHRDLLKLQEMGLVYVGSNGKRFLSEVGRSYLQSLLSL